AGYCLGSAAVWRRSGGRDVESTRCEWGRCRVQQHLGGYEEREDDSVGLMGDDRLDEFAAPRRRWPTAVLTGIVMAVFAGGLWFFYHQGVRQAAPGPGGEVPLIRADDKPMKMKP